MSDDFDAAKKRLEEWPYQDDGYRADLGLLLNEVERLNTKYAVAMGALEGMGQRAEKAEAELAGRPHAESLATAVKRIEELEDAGIAENHAILILTDVPREGYTLQEEIRAQLEEAQVELAAERDGALALRVELGARDDETFPAFVRRLSIQSETWRNDLAAERERAKRLEQALAGWLATESLPDCRACAVLDAGLPELALRPAAPEAKESDCTCGEQWPCPLHGGPPAAPEPTPSHYFEIDGRYTAIVCRNCGQPESAHGRNE